MLPRTLPIRKDKNIALPYLPLSHYILVPYTIQISHDKTEMVNSDVEFFQGRQR